jgi:ribose transport system substrate-binding protein
VSETTVRAVARACDILAAFREHDEVLELHHIAERTGLNKVTASRLLHTLESKRLVEQVSTRGYRSCFRPLNARVFRIGYAAQSTIRPYINTVSESLSVAARAANIDLVILNNKFSRSVALRNADAFIRLKVDLVIEFQVAYDIAGRVAEKFQAAALPMIAVDVPHPGAVYLGPDSYRAGHMAGLHLGGWVAKNWNGRIDEIVLLDSALAGPAVAARLRGMLDGANDVLPGIEKIKLSRYDSKGRYWKAFEAVATHLRRSNAERILIGALNDASALGALQAFRDLGIEDHCAVAGQDGIAEARAELRNPATRLICTVAYFPEAYGARLVRLSLDMLNGRTVPHVCLTQHRLLTPSSVDSIYPNDTWLSYSDVGGGTQW